MQNKISVLLIDDSDGVKASIRESLRVGFDVHCVNTLCEAIFLIQKSHFDIILLDLGLPDSKGLGSFDKLINYFPSIPIIIITAREDEDLARSAISKGAQDYIYKSEFPIFTLNRNIMFSIERNNFRLKALNVAQTVDKYIDDVTKLIEECKNV